MKAVGTFHIHILNNHVLELYDVFYVPSSKRNLISMPKLIPFDYHLVLSKKLMTLTKNSVLIANLVMIDGLFKIVCDLPQSLTVSHGTKRSVIDETSYSLWHRRLGHISVDRIKMLNKEEFFHL